MQRYMMVVCQLFIGVMIVCGQLFYKRKKMTARNKNRPGGKQQDSIPTFLAKTYDMLERPENEKMISWTPDGTAFRVKNVTDFTNKVLPKYFKHNNYASFIRQLNMYGFHKVKSDPPYQTFKHQKFERGNKAQLGEIKRKAHQQMKDQIIDEQESSDHNNSMGNQIQSMKRKQDQLEKVVDILVEQNKQILQDNRHLWNKMKKTIDKEEKRLESIIVLLLFGGKGLTDKPNNQICQQEQSEDDNSANNNVPTNALLPFDDANTNKLALQTLYNQLQKRKSKSKKKFEDELFLHNQGEHLKIINNLVNRLNNVKNEQQQMNLKPDPLQIENQDSKSNVPPLPLKSIPEIEAPIMSPSLEHHDLPHSPFMPSSPFMRRMSSDFVDGDEAINRFLLNRSEDEFHLSKDHEKQSDLDHHFDPNDNSMEHPSLNLDPHLIEPDQHTQQDHMDQEHSKKLAGDSFSLAEALKQPERIKSIENSKQAK